MVNEHYDSIWQWMLHGGFALGLYLGFLLGVIFILSIIANTIIRNNG